MFSANPLRLIELTKAPGTKTLDLQLHFLNLVHNCFQRVRLTQLIALKLIVRRKASFSVASKQNQTLLTQDMETL